jgi:hypothetical protein
MSLTQHTHCCKNKKHEYAIMFFMFGKEGGLPSELLTVSDHSCNTGFERIREDEFLCWHFISL